eukprot:Colp12_sorted_trinity150504_noHs@32802
MSMDVRRMGGQCSNRGGIVVVRVGIAADTSHRARGLRDHFDTRGSDVRGTTTSSPRAIKICLTTTTTTTTSYTTTTDTSTNHTLITTELKASAIAVQQFGVYIHHT